jgi:putative hydrolase of the HAD superfamily
MTAVLFDFGGTLDADGIRWSVRFHDAYRAAGGQLDFAAFEPLFQRSDEWLAGLPGVRRLGFRDTIDAQARLLARLLPDTRSVSWARIAERFHSQSVAMIERNRPLLERLGGNYRLGMISNFTGNLAPCLEELDLAHFFPVALDSAVEGTEKPDQRLFGRALAALDVPPADAWMVGDNFDADIQPARALGLRVCWVAPAERPAPASAEGIARVARLIDLEAVLGSSEATAGRAKR